MRQYSNSAANTWNTLLKAWNLLGLQRNNSNRTIKKKYYKLAAVLHPNKGGNTAKFQELQRLYEAALKAYAARQLNAVANAAAAASKPTRAGPSSQQRNRRQPYRRPPAAANVVLFSARSKGSGPWRRRSGFYGLTD